MSFFRESYQAATAAPLPTSGLRCRFCETEFGQHLPRVLAEQRCRARDLARRRESLIGRPSARGAASARMIEFTTIVARQACGSRATSAIELIGRRARLGFERRRSLAPVPGLQLFAHRRGERAGSSCARVGAKARVLEPVGRAEHARQALPVRLVGAADVEPAVGGAKRLVRRATGCAPSRSGRATRRWRSRSPPASRSAGCRLEERGVDQLALRRSSGGARRPTRRRARRACRR